MLERLRHYEAAHTRSGKAMSLVQKLTLYWGSQRRYILGARALIEKVARENPGVKQQCYDALIALGAAEDVLVNEYKRDRHALDLHKTQQDAQNSALDQVS